MGYPHPRVTHFNLPNNSPCFNITPTVPQHNSSCYCCCCSYTNKTTATDTPSPSQGYPNPTTLHLPFETNGNELSKAEHIINHEQTIGLGSGLRWNPTQSSCRHWNNSIDVGHATLQPKKNVEEETRANRGRKR